MAVAAAAVVVAMFGFVGDTGVGDIEMMPAGR